MGKSGSNSCQSIKLASTITITSKRFYMITSYIKYLYSVVTCISYKEMVLFVAIPLRELNWPAPEPDPPNDFT